MKIPLRKALLRYAPLLVLTAAIAAVRIGAAEGTYARAFAASVMLLAGIMILRQASTDGRMR